MATRRIEIPRGEKVALEKFLVRALPNADAARVKRLLDEGRVRVNGKVAKAGRKTWGGETVEIDLPAPAAPKAVEGPALELLHRSAHVIVVNKPPGLVVEPEPNQTSVAELLAVQHGPFDTNGTALPGVVHRLDKETSGCLAFGTTDDGVRLLKEGFEAKRIHKRYLAIVEGTPPATGALDTPYAKGLDGKYTTTIDSPRRARLSWVVKETFSKASLVEVELETGRTHQIRVQLSEAGHPVLGDRLYGRAFDEVRLPRLALHAARLELDLPALAATAEAPFPADLGQLLAHLRGSSDTGLLNVLHRAAHDDDPR